MIRATYLSTLCLGSLLTLIFCQPAAAQEVDYGKLLERQSTDGVTYLSGGIGQGERDYLRQQEKNFNLKLVFALEQGNYLALVNVLVENNQGRKILEAVSQGPWFYAELPPGNYTVTATSMQEKTLRKQVQVPETGRQELRFTWSRKINADQR